VAVTAPFVVHCLTEKKKQLDEAAGSRPTYQQPYKHNPQNSSLDASSGADGPASVEMSALLDDRGARMSSKNPGGGADLLNILRQSYDHLTTMPKLQWTYDGRLAYKASYEGHEAFLRYSSLAES